MSIPLIALGLQCDAMHTQLKEPFMGSLEPKGALTTLNELERLRNSTTEAERRQFNRFVVRGDGELQPMSRMPISPQPIEIALRDVDQGGLGFITVGSLAVNSAWRCGFLVQGHIVDRQALLVRHCRLVRDNLYLVGAQFISDTGLLVLLGVDVAALEMPRQSA